MILKALLWLWECLRRLFPPHSMWVLIFELTENDCLMDKVWWIWFRVPSVMAFLLLFQPHLSVTAHPWEGNDHMFIHSFSLLIFIMHQMVSSSGQGSQERTEKTQTPRSPGVDILVPWHLKLLRICTLSFLLKCPTPRNPIICSTQAPTFVGNFSQLSQITESLNRAPRVCLRAFPPGTGTSFVYLNPHYSTNVPVLDAFMHRQHPGTGPAQGRAP